MAMAKLVCGECGAALAQSDRFCPRCGARAEGSPPQQPADQPSRVRCKACGREVSPNANFCESCGASLGAGGPRQQKRKPQNKGQSPERRMKEERKFRWEPWQIITGAVVVLVIAFFT